MNVVIRNLTLTLVGAISQIRMSTRMDSVYCRNTDTSVSGHVVASSSDNGYRSGNRMSVCKRVISVFTSSNVVAVISLPNKFE